MSAGEVRKNFEKDGFKVSGFSVDTKRGRVAMNISGRVAKNVIPLDFRGSSAMVQARFVGVRSGAYVVSAIVVSERKNWAGKLASSYRRAAEGLQARR